MSHSIFIRERVGGRTRPPSMLAYDISERQEAEAIVKNIVASYPEHGIDSNSQIQWFLYNGCVHEIYVRTHRL